MVSDNNIEQLIDKYFQGETSIVEEKSLKDYFSSPYVAQHLEHYKPLFQYYREARQEQFVATLPLQTSSNRKSPRKIVWLSVAASVVVMLGVGFYAYNNSVTYAESDGYGTCETPEEAFEETQKALQLVSEHLNTGIESVAYLNEYQQSKNKIFK